LFSNRVLGSQFQPQRLKHGRAFAFPAYGRKFKPPAMRVGVDSAWANLMATLPDSEFRRRIGVHLDSLIDATRMIRYIQENRRIFVGKSIFCLIPPAR